MSEPDHYSLLGLPFFERDHGTIVRAAMERIRLLESCQADPRPGHQQALQDLLTEVRQAQITLLDAHKRRIYDATLIGSGEAEAEQEQPDDEIELRAGTMVAGRYRVLGERRRGCFGVVYDALDSNMRTRVELSVLRPRLSKNRSSRRRAERAARAVAALDHPNIVRVDEVGDADGLLFVRMRQVEGKSLLETIEATPKMRLEAEQVREVTRQIAAGLAYAHENDIRHGDLRPHSVYLAADGRVVVADFRISRVVLDELQERTPRTRAPEDEDSVAADLFSLGCLAYQMLAGMPPFAAGTTRFVPRPLTEDVPEDLEVLVTRLLARDPDQRPASAAEVVARLTPQSKSRRLPVLLAVATVLVVALGAALLAQKGGDRSPKSTVAGEGWRLIAEKRFDDALRQLRRAHRSNPADATLRAPLAGALDRKAALLEQARDPWGAQLLLQEAQQVFPQAERESELDRIRKIALGILDRIRVEVPEVSSAPIVRVHVGRDFEGRVEIGGQSVQAAKGVAQRAFELADGPHGIGFVLVDRVGNRRAGSVRTIVDTVVPRIAILSPRDGAFLSKGEIAVKVRVEEANPLDQITIKGRVVKLVGGGAAELFRLADGRHKIDVLVEDRAGLRATASVTVVIDSNAPDLRLAVDRVVTADGGATIRGSIKTKGSKVVVDGRPVLLGEDGSFESTVHAGEDRLVPVEATGPTGLRKKLSVRVEIDDRPPELNVEWKRRDRKGVLLYGAREMDAHILRLPLRVTDKTRVTYLPGEGKVADGVWELEPHEGAREVRLVARDEAGNAATLVLAVEGHRARPTLVVKNNTPERTNGDEAVLAIEADGTLYVQGREVEPGRIKLPLPEGRMDLLVRAVDRYGNETRWSRTLHVDRTPPKLRLQGEPERGIGRQVLRFESDEDLASLTCFGKTTPVKGRSVRITADLRIGRRRLAVLARDLAGNTTKMNVPLRVVNKVLALDGKSAVRVVLPKELGALERFTIECWVRGFDAEGKTVVLARSARSSGFGLFWRREEGGLPYAALILRESGFMTLPARKEWRWERWTHLALSYDGKRARFFVNGSQHHVVVTETPFATGQAPLLIGAGPDARNHARYFFRGAIDELRLSSVARYARAFSPLRYHKEDRDTILLLRFDTMVGEKFADTSGHGLHATPIGNPVLKEENR